MTLVGTPKDISDIAVGIQAGNQKAARATFYEFGTVLGEAVAVLLTLFDGLVVLGGGVSGAYDLFAPALFRTLCSSIKLPDNTSRSRVLQEVFDLTDPVETEKFIRGNTKTLTLPDTQQQIRYDAAFRTGIGLAKHDTSNSIALGAYAFAIKKLDGL